MRNGKEDREARAREEMKLGAMKEGATLLVPVKICFEISLLRFEMCESEIHFGRFLSLLTRKRAF